LNINFKVGLWEATCNLAATPVIACDKNITNLVCSNTVSSGTCICNSPWTWDSASKTCKCTNPLYQISDTSCRIKKNDLFLQEVNEINFFYFKFKKLVSEEHRVVLLQFQQLTVILPLIFHVILEHALAIYRGH